VFSTTNRILETEYHHLSLCYFFSFALGIICFFTQDFALTIESCLVICLLLISGLYLKKTQTNITLQFILSCLLMFNIGLIASQYRISQINTNILQQEKIVNFTGTVQYIKPNLRGQQVTIGSISAKHNRELNKVRINLGSKTQIDLNKGDLVQMRARLFPLSSNLLPNSFNFGFYLKTQGIQATGYALQKPYILKHNSTNFEQKIFQARRHIYNKLITLLGVKTGNFAAAILIGETKAIPENVASNMRDTGVAHILSVSGLHLSLVALICFVCSRALLNFSNYLAYNTNIKLIAAFISIIGSFLYLLISGSNIAATRAFIMTSIFMLATMIGRSPYPLRSVSIAAFCILLFLPEYVLHPSFQLSFTAVLCLISGYNLHQTNILKQNSKSIYSTCKIYLFTNIYTSLLASIATAPYVIFHFYKFANYSVLMNLIAVPLMSFCIMPLALLSLFLMPLDLHYTALKSMGFFIDLVINASEYVVNLPMAVLNLGSISPISLMVYSIGFCWICFWQYRIKYLGILIIIISIFVTLFYQKPDVIINKKQQIISLKDQNKILLYSNQKLSAFTINYWQSWYGINDIEHLKENLFNQNKLIKLSSHSVSFNYSKCISADLMVVTSKYLRCNNKNAAYLKDYDTQQPVGLGIKTNPSAE